MQSSYIFWSHDVVQTVPNATWTPFLLNARHSEVPRGKWAYGAKMDGSTTVAVASNGQALPQATINLTDTSTLANEGFLAFRMPGTKDVAVRYTGKTSTTVTGCTGGVGTLTTGMAVRQGNCYFRPNYHSMTALIAEVAFASNATGIRGIRMNSNFPSFTITGAEMTVPAYAATDPYLHVQTAEQPAFFSDSGPAFIEIYQSSTGPLDTQLVSLAAPRLVVACLFSLAHGEE